MGSCYAKDVVNAALGEVGYQCGENKWNKYADLLDKCNYFTGCGDKQNLDFCAVGLCWCVYVACKYPDYESEPDSAKWTAHFFTYQSDSCNTAAVVKYLYGFFPEDAITDNPERGDFAIFQKSNGVMYHCGIVTSWDNDYIYITEFNTEVGQVLTHAYPYSAIGNKIKCFCRPRYDGWEEGTEDNGSNGKETENNGSNGKETENTGSNGKETENSQSSFSHVLTDAVIEDLARRCIEGEFGNFPLRKQLINSLGYGPIYSQVQKRVNMIVYGR